MDGRGERGDGDARIGDLAAVQDDDCRRAHDRDLHLPSVLEPHVTRAGARGRLRYLDGGQQLACVRGGLPGTGEQLGDRQLTGAAAGLERDGRVEADEGASPVSMAGDAFMRLPPIVPWARVACEPTIAEASASAVKRSRTTGWVTSSSWVASAPSRRPPPDPLMPRSAVDGVDRDDAVRERGLALAGADDEIGAARQPGGRRRSSRRAPPRRSTRRRRCSPVTSCARRPDPLGGHRQLA